MANPEHLRIILQGVDVWNEWRKKNPLIVPDLSYDRIKITTTLQQADLRNVNLDSQSLSHQDFRGANLDGACLVGSTLDDSDFSDTNLTGLNLSVSTTTGCITTLSRAVMKNVNLSFANLASAQLDGAILTGANLTEANLSGADLHGTDLSNAYFHRTVLCGMDLSACIGLETIRHGAPSSIGIDTIYQSQANIPESFLRSAGVPESFIAEAKLLVAAMEPIQFYSCFISYSHSNKGFAHRLYRQLHKLGIRCWLDEHQLVPGDDIYHAIDSAIRLWDKVLLCCSEASLKSWWVDNEIGAALEKEKKLTKERGHKVHVLVPLNLDGYFFSNEWTSGYQAQLRRRLAADFTGIANDSRKFAAHVKRVVLALRADEAVRERPPATKL